MARYAMVDPASGIVLNIVMWDGDEAEWRAPPNTEMVPDPDRVAGPGFHWDGTAFTPPPAGLPGTSYVTE